MVTSLNDVRSVVEKLWPPSRSESWDAVGLVCGNPSATVTKILLAVDAVHTTVDEAINTGCDLLIVHHPLLLRGVTTVAEDFYKGSLLSRLITHGCGLLTAHTNADIVHDGVSDIFAQRLGLVNIKPIVPHPDDPAIGLGRFGDFVEPLTLERLATDIAELLPPTASGIRVAGNPDTPVKRVALCGGAGDSLLHNPTVLNADVYITSDLRHHPASEAREQAVITGNPVLIDVSHWASESLWLDTAAQQLHSRLPDVRVDISVHCTDPWTFSLATLTAEHFRQNERSV